MAFSRRYTLHEVKGMLAIYRDNHAVRNVNPDTHRVTRAEAGAHAHIHGESNFLDQRNRVNTPGQPRTTGTYRSIDDQAAATCELLNSYTGRIALRRLDIGESSAVMETNLTPDLYPMSTAVDASAAAGPGHFNRNDAGRAGAGSIHTQTFAKKGFAKVVKGVGGLLQIQTSYPIS